MDLLVNSEASLANAISQLVKAFEEKRFVRLKMSTGRANSWPMQKTWRMWMKETANWMAANGATMPLVMKHGKAHKTRPFNEQDAHELFVRTYLGQDDNGDRFHTGAGADDRDKMLLMMDMHLAWATERGIRLTIPGDGEYIKLRDQQNV